MAVNPWTRAGLAAGVAAGGVVAAALVRRVAEGPTGEREAAEAAALLDLPPHRELTVTTADGARLAAAAMGDRSAPLVVAVHGWAADRQVWAGCCRRLLNLGRQVVVYDQRGHGHSTVGPAGTTVEALGDDLAAVLDAVDATGAVVVGHSMGGMAVQAFALEHRRVVARRVAGLVLAATEAAPALEGLGPRWAGAWRDVPRGAAAWLAAAGPVDWLVGTRNTGNALVRATFGRAASPAELEATRVGWATTPAAVRSGFVDAMSRLDLAARLPALDVPTVVVCGQRDAVTAPDRSREIVRLVPGARLELLPGLGHQLPFEAPEQLAAIAVDLQDAVGESAGRDVS